MIAIIGRVCLAQAGKRLGPTVIPVSVNIHPLIPSRQISFLLHSHSQTFAIGDQPLPVNLLASKYRGFNGRADLSPRIPKLTKRKPVRLGDILKPLVNPFHGAFDFAQSLLSIATARYREAEIK